MGVAFYPVFEDGSGEWVEYVAGKCLARAADELEKPCQRASLPTLYDFFSMSRNDMIAELLGGDPDDPTTFDASKLPEEHWFEAATGLDTVRCLLEFVRSKVDSAPEYRCVCDDLEAFERNLIKAAETNVRWHLGIDY
jgi:hypothetical protein